MSAVNLTKTQIIRTGDATKYRKEYKCWHAIIQRCLNPKYKNYRLYGARGIKVCDQWIGPNGFAQFLKDVGPSPSPKHSLDRVDNDGNYESGNVRWATNLEQCRNKRNNTFLEYKGERLIIRDWANRLGINEQTLHERLKRGWSVERTLTTPVRS